MKKKNKRIFYFNLYLNKNVLWLSLRLHHSFAKHRGGGGRVLKISTCWSTIIPCNENLQRGHTCTKYVYHVLISYLNSQLVPWIYDKLVKKKYCTTCTLNLVYRCWDLLICGMNMKTKSERATGKINHRDCVIIEWAHKQ